MRLPPAAERLATEMKARYEIDVAGMVAGVRARLESRLALSPLQIDADLEERRAPFGIGHVRTTVFQAPRLRKLVLAEVRLWPVIEGFALTLLPELSVAAPVFAADFMLLPDRLSANADVYGAPERTRGVLTPLGDSFRQLGGGAGRPWTAPIRSGEGLFARVSPRIVGEAFGATTSALGLYLDALAAAPAGDEERAQREFFQRFHEHGPRHGALRWIFGEAWAERFSRLAFE